MKKKQQTIISFPSSAAIGDLILVGLFIYFVQPTPKEQILRQFGQSDLGDQASHLVWMICIQLVFDLVWFS